jgi:DNA (cytosine-5)-methyltransferase 1
MQVNPTEIGIRRGNLHFMVASPECKWHSRARGNKPINDQLRVSAWDVVRFIEELQPWVVMIENVMEFSDWGPITKAGRPIKRFKGKIFKAWCAAIQALSYKLDRRIVCSSDHGDPTIRKRLFILAYRTASPEFSWPVPTHSKNGVNGLKPWRPALEVIDRDYPSKSVFDPTRKPLCKNTIDRIAAGVKKFYGPYAEPFLVMLNGGGRKGAGGTQSLLHPLPVVTAGGKKFGVVIPQMSRNPPRDAAASPLDTITTTSRGIGFVQPFLTQFSHKQGLESRVKNLADPMPTLTTKSEHGVAIPLIIPPEGIHRGNQARDTADPFQTITASRGGGHVLEPLVIHNNHGGDHERRSKPASSEPMPTVTGSRGLSLLEPFLTLHYSGGGQLSDIKQPVPTVVTNDRISVVEPQQEGYVVDLLYRMLHNGELAKAMGFPDSYIFKGSSTDQTKQIGNAVTVNTARSLALAQLLMLLSKV